MKKHLELLSRLKAIEPILALRTLLDRDSYSYEGDEFHTSNSEESRELFAAHLSTPVLTVHWSPERVEVIASPELWVQDDHPIRILLQTLGMKTASWQIDTEIIWDRMLAIDGAYCLLRRLSDLAAPRQNQLSEEILRLADEWSVIRLAIFEGRATAKQREIRDQLETRLRQIPSEFPEILYCCGQEDPRGSALQIHIHGLHWPTEICALNISWQIGPGHSSASKSASKIYQGKFAPKPTRVEQPVLDVIASMTISDNKAVISQRLSPKLYSKVNDLLNECGAQWSTAVQAHILSEGAKSKIDQVMHDGFIYTARDFEFFETQPQEVNRLILNANLAPGMKVLEPQAGRGALAMAAAEVVGKGNVTCFELMPQNCAHLKTLGFSTEEPCDFLAVKPTPEFDRVVMNPPFSGGKDIAHVMHAMQFLKPRGRLVAIVSTTWLTTENKRNLEFRKFVDEHAIAVEDIPAGAFKATGTNVATKLITLQAPSAKAAQEPSSKTELLQAALF